MARLITPCNTPSPTVAARASSAARIPTTGAQPAGTMPTPIHTSSTPERGAKATPIAPVKIETRLMTVTPMTVAMAVLASARHIEGSMNWCQSESR